MVTSTFNSRVLDTELGNLVLIIRGTSRNGQTLRLKSPKCTIGSGPNCTLRLQAKGVDPLHCLILRGPSGAIIRRWSPDTRLNGQPFTDAPLSSGDCLSIGPVELEIVATGETAVHPPASSSLPDQCQQYPTAPGQGDSTNTEEALRLDALEKQLRETQQALDLRASQLESDAATLHAQQVEFEEQRCRREEINASSDLEGSQRLAAAEEQLARLKTGWADLDSQRQNLNLLKQQSQTEQDAALQKIQEREQKCNRRAAELDASATDLQTRLAQLEIQTSAFEFRENQIADQLNELSLQRGKNSQSAGELDARSEDLDARAAELHTKTAELQAQTADLKKRSARLDAQALKLENQEAEIKKQSDQQNARTAELKAKSNELQAKTEKFDADTKEFDAKAEILDAKTAELDARISEFDAKAAELKTKAKILDDKSAKLDARIAELDAKTEEIEAKAENIDDKTAELETRISEFDAKAAELKIKAENIDDKTAELEAMIAEFNAKTSELNTKAEKIEAKAQELDAKAENIDVKTAELDERMTEFETKAAELETKRLELETDSANWEQTWRDKNSSLSSWETDIAKKTADLKTMEEQLRLEREQFDSRLAQSRQDTKQSEGDQTPQAQSVEISPSASLPAAEAATKPSSGDAPANISRHGREADVLQQNLAADQGPAGDKATAVSAQQAAEHEEEESLDEYMARLMERIRSTQGELSGNLPNLTPPAARKPEPAPPVTAPMYSSDSATPGPAQHRNPMADLSPRTQAPENRAGLSLFRDLANFSAQSALGTHAKRQTTLIMYSKLMVAIIGGFTGLGLLLLWRTWLPNRLTLFSAITSFVVAVIWGIQYVFNSIKLLREESDNLIPKHMSNLKDEMEKKQIEKRTTAAIAADKPSPQIEKPAEAFKTLPPSADATSNPSDFLG